MTFSNGQAPIPQAMVNHLSNFLKTAAYWGKEAEYRMARGESRFSVQSALLMQKDANDAFFRTTESLITLRDDNRLDHSARKLIRWKP